jgi:hypothetical protein
MGFHLLPGIDFLVRIMYGAECRNSRASLDIATTHRSCVAGRQARRGINLSQFQESDIPYFKQNYISLCYTYTINSNSYNGTRIFKTANKPTELRIYTQNRSRSEAGIAQSA